MFTVLIFYAKFGFYEKGYELCERVCSQYSADIYIVSAMIECCVHTDHLNEASNYAYKFIDNEGNGSCYKKKKRYDKTLQDLVCSEMYRKNKIDTYRSYPPLLESCCYYGCETHHVEWLS